MKGRYTILTKTKIRRFSLLLAVLSLLFCLSSCAESRSFTLSVLAMGEGDCEVTDEPLKQVPYGGDASFTLSMPEGDTVIQVLADGLPTEDYTYADGVLTLKNVTSPTTLRVVSGDPATQSYYGVEVTSKYGGRIELSTNEGRVAKGTLVTFRAVLKDGAAFTGWSLKKPLSSGGTLLSDEEQMTIAIDENKFIYANFDISGVEIPETKTTTVQSKNNLMIYYNNNGGNLLSGNKVAYEYSFDMTYWSMPTAMEDNGTFTRDGYVLLGYSTDPDGGELIRPGHKFILPEGTDKTLMLYCVWQEETSASDFTYTDLGNNNIRIDKYSGSDSVIYIPRKIGGKTVRQIGGECFTGSEITEVYIPSSVGMVADGAFADCKSLTTITMYDTVTSISDAAFTGSPVKTFRLCAGTSPRFMTSGYCFGQKYERMMLNADSPRIVFVAGSSKHYGLDTEQMEELLGGDLVVVNYGTNANMNILFYLEAVAANLDEDDILVYSPEQYGPYAYWTNGNPEMQSVNYQGIESAYNLMECVDVSSYTNVFTAFAQYTTSRQKMGAQTWDKYPTGTDKVGDLVSARKGYNSDSFHYKANGSFRFNETVIPEAFIPNMNRVLDFAVEQGTTVYFSHPPYNINAIEADSLNEESYDSYHAWLEDILDVPLISDVRNYIFGGKYFSNTDYHLNAAGMALHTEQLAKDILAAMED